MKNNLLRLLIFASFSIILSSCHHSDKTGNEAVIYGEYKTDNRSKLVLYQVDTVGFHAVDSVEIRRNGSYSFTINSPQPDFYFIKSRQQTSEIIVAHPGDSIKAIFQPGLGVMFSGGKEAESQQLFLNEVANTEMRIDSMSKELELARIGDEYSITRKLADSLLDAEIARIKFKAEKFFPDHPDALSQLLVLNARIRQVAVFEEYVDYKWYFYTDSALTANYPDHKHVMKHHRKVQQLRRIIQAEEQAIASGMMNEMAPEIALPSVSGSIMQLHQNLGHQTVLYFWSPADSDSKKVNSELKKLQEQVKSKDLKIFAVALDPFPERWKATITLQKLWWNNVNDTMANGSTVAKTYRLNHFPTFFLLDSKGRLQQRFLSVKALAAWLRNDE